MISQGNFTLDVFIDTNWVGNVDNRKRTTSGAFLLGGRLVAWTSKKQTCVSHSTVKVEYVAASMNCTQTIQMRHVLEGFKIDMSKPATIYCDNTSTINISKNHVLHARTKHIELMYHFLRERFQEKEVNMEYVKSKDQLADIFTKPLPKATFEFLRGKLGVRPLHRKNQNARDASILWILCLSFTKD